MNNLKTALLLAGLTALLVVIGGLLGGRAGLIIALLFAGVLNMGAYWYSDQLMLKIYKAQPIGPQDGFELYQIVQHLAQKANLPMPQVYLIDSKAPNAFATGRNPEHASVAATTGLIALLSKEELTGVLAHELSHILHRDTLISAVSATIAGAISGIANLFLWFSLFGGGDENAPHPLVGLLLMILAPIAAMLIQMAISRAREFEADAHGAELAGNPLWLASALKKLEQGSHQTSLPAAETHPATAHLFIVNPLQGKKLAELFSTHPLTEERIQRLQQLSTKMKNPLPKQWYS